MTRRQIAVAHHLTTLDRALSSKRLLGLGAESWLTWRSVLKAAYAEPLDDIERAAFDKVAGGRSPPQRKVKELAAVISRRGGKGRAAGGLATYESALVDHSAVWLRVRSASLLASRRLASKPGLFSAMRSAFLKRRRCCVTKLAK